jgi:hypothetical protein
VKPWVMNCQIQGLTKECIIDTGCNITAIPLRLTQKLGLRILPAKHILVTIADGSTYNPIGVVDIIISVAGIQTTVRTLVSTGDQVLLGLEWMEKVGCILDIPARRLTISQEHKQIVVHLQNITLKARTAHLQVKERMQSMDEKDPQFRLSNFISYTVPDDKLHVWDIPAPTQASPKPRPVHQNAFLLRAQKDLVLEPFTQHIHSSDIAIACPKDQYIEIEP